MVMVVIEPFVYFCRDKQGMEYVTTGLLYMC